jgi:hypothetical protein
MTLLCLPCHPVEVREGECLIGAAKTSSDRATPQAGGIPGLLGRLGRGNRQALDRLLAVASTGSSAELRLVMAR